MNILVAVFSDPAWSLPPEQVERLRRIFPHHRFEFARSEPELLEGLTSADIAFSGQITGAALARAPRLRWVQSPAAGVGRLLSPELRARDIIVTNARGIHGAPIAEHVLGVSIALARQFGIAMRDQVAHRWQKPRIAEIMTLAGRRMGIVGLGAIGTAVARMAASAGMRVSGLRRNPDHPPVAFVDLVYRPGQLDELLAASDIVVLAAPLTPETSGMIGSRELRLMKRDAFLVNVARGKLVREDELARELAAGTIGGAALDVFEHEPLDPASPLWDLPNVIITPHTSAFFTGYWELAVDLFAQNLRRFENGEPLVNVVDKGAGY
jgi:phosphoglycerate dehydrogenase-like enzyme